MSAIRDLDKLAKDVQRGATRLQLIETLVMDIY